MISRTERSAATPSRARSEKTSVSLTLSLSGTGHIIVLFISMFKILVEFFETSSYNSNSVAYF